LFKVCVPVTKKKEKKGLQNYHILLTFVPFRGGEKELGPDTFENIKEREKGGTAWRLFYFSTPRR